MTRHHATGAIIGTIAALFFAMMASNVTAGAAALASGEVTLLGDTQ